MFRTAILDTDDEGEKLIKAVEAVLQSAAQSGGTVYAFTRSEKTSEYVTQHHWVAGSKGTSFTVVEDAMLGGVYVMSQARDEAAAEATIRHMKESIGTFSCAQVRTVLTADIEEEYPRMPMLSLCASKAYDPETERLLLEWIRHGNRDVRLAAAQVMGMLDWPKLRDALASARKRESDADILETIDVALTTRRAPGD
jgi:hypothetical protein